MKKICAFLCFLLIAASCKKSKDVTCTNGSFSMVGVGFSDSDFNGATITQYKTGTNFGKALQSCNITYYLWVRGTVTSDSGNISVPALALPHTPNEIAAAYDYVISIPAAGVNDTISNVTFLGTTHKTMSYNWPYNDFPLVCFNPITSYTYN